MKLSRLLFIVTTLTVALLFTLPISTAVAGSTVDTTKVIKSVDAAGSSVVIQYMSDKTLHPYKIDDVTMLKVNNVAGKVADIKPGMVVDDFVERDDQTLDGLSVSGNGTSPPAAKPTAKPKPKPKPTTPTPPQT
jgi:hypothetical protein